MATWKKVITTNDDSDYKNSNAKAPFFMQWSMRWYTDANNAMLGTARRKWFHPNTTYGPSYYQWSSSTTGADPRTLWYDSWNPCIRVPKDMTLKKFSLAGNIDLPSGTSSIPLLLELKTNTNAVDWDDTNVANIPISTLGSRVQTDFSDSTYVELTGNPNQAMEYGDIIIPFLARDGLLTSNSSYYVEGVFSLEFEVDLV